uniref:Uncharacterized protein n=1 Tax=Arion vulgaris TaxID=1028688 RepID=A0A0B6Z4L9_9EUPU
MLPKITTQNCETYNLGLLAEGSSSSRLSRGETTNVTENVQTANILAQMNASNDMSKTILRI